MCATFSQDDIDKTVENANGDEIGTVTEIEDDVATVEPHSGVMDSIRAALGWERTHEGTVQIQRDSVDSISDDVIRLEADSEPPDGRDPADIDASDRQSRGDPSSEPADEHGLETDDSGPVDRATAGDRERTRDEETGRIGAERTTDRDETVGEIEASEPTAEPEQRTPAEPVEEMDADERRPSDGIGGNEDTDAADGTHPAADIDEADAATDPDSPIGADDPVTTDERGTSGVDRSRETTDSAAADEREAFEAPSAADERVDLDARGGVHETDAFDETASTDEPDASRLGDVTGTDADDSGIDTDDSDDSGDRDLTESSRTDSTGEPESGSAGSDDDGGAPDEAASTVDMADERGVTDGTSSTEIQPERATETAVSETDDETESAGETDAENEFDRRGATDSLDAVSDGLDDDDQHSTEAMDLADRLDTGVDIESASDSSEPDTSADAATTAEERDLTAQLDRGADIEAVAADDGTSTTDEDADSGRAVERDLVDELARGPDLASVAAADREPSAAIDPETIRGRDADTGGDTETADRRIVTDDGSHVDHRPAETAGEHDRTAMETLESKPGAAATEDDTVVEGPSEAMADRRRTASPLSAMVAAQRAALEPGRRAVENGIAAQQQLVRAVVTGAAALQRRQLRLAETVASTPFELAAGMMGAGDGASGHADAAAHRLELVDGLDTMYRKRLVDAGITSLDDLARAERRTVADAAGVTEKRAAGWIEQVDR